MKRYLATGLESSCTKVFAQGLAESLNIPEWNNYDGHGVISSVSFLVSHLSLPHGPRKTNTNVDLNSFPNIVPSEWEHVVICTRDYNCALRSKMVSHQPRHHISIAEQQIGISQMRELVGIDNVHVFSYESWYLLGVEYIREFYKRHLGIEYRSKIDVKEINNKHIIPTQGA